MTRFSITIELDIGSGPNSSWTFNIAYTPTGPTPSQLPAQPSVDPDAPITQLTRPQIDYSTAFSNFADAPSIATAEKACDNSIAYIHSLQSYYGERNTFIQTRSQFTTDISNTMNEGSDKITLADINEENAKYLSLQTRDQITNQNISLSNQQQQSIFALFLINK